MKQKWDVPRVKAIIFDELSLRETEISVNELSRLLYDAYKVPKNYVIRAYKELEEENIIGKRTESQFRGGRIFYLKIKQNWMKGKIDTVEKVIDEFWTIHEKAFQTVKKHPIFLKKKKKFVTQHGIRMQTSMQATNNPVNVYSLMMIRSSLENLFRDVAVLTFGRTTEVIPKTYEIRIKKLAKKFSALAKQTIKQLKENQVNDRLLRGYLQMYFLPILQLTSYEQFIDKPKKRERKK